MYLYIYSYIICVCVRERLGLSQVVLLSAAYGGGLPKWCSEQVLRTKCSGVRVTYLEVRVIIVGGRSDCT